MQDQALSFANLDLGLVYCMNPAYVLVLEDVGQSSCLNNYKDIHGEKSKCWLKLYNESFTFLCIRQGFNCKLQPPSWLFLTAHLEEALVLCCWIADEEKIFLFKPKRASYNARFNNPFSCKIPFLSAARSCLITLAIFTLVSSAIGVNAEPVLIAASLAQR